MSIDFSSKEDLMKLKGTAITEAFINHVVRSYTGKLQEVSQEQINAETQLKLRQVEIDELLEEREALQAQVAGLEKKVTQRNKSAAGEKKGTDQTDVLKKKLEKTEKELKETLQRMSSLVQKSNQPVVELTEKLKTAEKALAEQKERSKQLQIELEKASTVNSTM